MITLRDALSKLSEDEARDLAAKILGEIDFSNWQELIPELESVILSISQDGIRLGFDQIGHSPTADALNQVNEIAVEWAKDRAAEMVGMKRVDGELVTNPNAEWAITDSTRDMLRADVTRALEEGLGSRELAGQLESNYAFSSDRADRIARTEIASADIAGNMMAYRDSGVVTGKELVLGDDHEVEDECDEAAAMGVVDLEDDFGGYGDPPFHPGCACDVLPAVAVEEE